MFAQLALVLSLAASAQPVTTVDPVAQIKAAEDNLFGSGATYEFSYRTLADNDFPPFGLRTAIGLYARKGDTRAAMATYTYDSPPSFVPPGGHFDDYKGESLRVSRYLDVVSVQAPDSGESLVSLAVWGIPPTGAPSVLGNTHLRSKFPADARDVGHPLEFQASLASGRGFAAWLDYTISSTPSKGGILEVRARGTFSLIEGEWDLLVDPSQDWLIRRAEFRRTGTEDPLVSMHNTGLLKAQFPVPESGSTTYYGHPVELTVDTTFTRVTRGGAAIQQCTELLKNHPNATTMDNTQAPF